MPLGIQQRDTPHVRSHRQIQPTSKQMQQQQQDTTELRGLKATQGKASLAMALAMASRRKAGVLALNWQEGRFQASLLQGSLQGSVLLCMGRDTGAGAIRTAAPCPGGQLPRP